jgi:pilus assembly protein CpaF
MSSTTNTTTSAIDAYELIRRDVVARLGDEHWVAGHADERIRGTVTLAVDDYQSRAHHGEQPPLHDPAAMIERVLRAVTDLGPLTELVARHDVEEIFIEGARVSYLDDRGRLRGWVMPTSEDENRRAIEQLLAATDRQLHASSPLVQARVLDGTARLTAAIPPIADRLSATLRRYTVRSVSLERLSALGSLDAAAAAFLAATMRFRSRVAVSGDPGAGKTTLLAALLVAVPPEHCVRACEEIRELSVPFTHGAYYETRPPALDGSGEITLRQLVKFVLAMRPDRIVVGEVRGGEAFELTRAINAGCGFLCTVHANSAPEALHALVNAALMAGENVTERVVQRVFSSALDLVVHVERRDGSGGGARRQVSAVTAVVPALTDGFTCEPIFVRDGGDGPLRWTGSMPDRLEDRADRALGRRGALRAVLEAGGAS